MAKGIYLGIDSLSRKVKKMYLGIEGVARKVKKAYIGVNGIARLFFAGGGAASLFGKVMHNHLITSCGAGQRLLQGNI